MSASPMNASVSPQTSSASSPEHESSLIKVDTPQALSKVDLADESEGINQGERAMVLVIPQCL